MASDPEFLILKPAGGWLPAANERRLLGAAVKNYFDPLENSTPTEPLKYYDQKKHRMIDPMFTDLVLEKSDCQASGGELVIQGLARFFCRKSDEKLFNLKSKVFYVKRLTGVDDYWKRLTAEDPDFKPRVTEWLSQKRMLGLKSRYQVYLVTGIMMCQDVVVAASQEEARELRMTAQVKLGTIAQAAAASQGMPVSTGGVGNVSAGTTREERRLTYFGAKGSAKMIFAVQLKRITLKGGKLVLGDEGPDVKAARRLGEEASDDFVLEDLTPEDWAAIVDESDAAEPEKEAEPDEEKPRDKTSV